MKTPIAAAVGGFLGALFGRRGLKGFGGAVFVLYLAVLFVGKWLIENQWVVVLAVIGGLWWLATKVERRYAVGWDRLHLPHPRAPRPVREPIPRELREQIIARDNSMCGICGFRCTDPADIHIDHIHPVHAGGTNHPSNLQTSHSDCNLRKGGMVGWTPPYRRTV